MIAELGHYTLILALITAFLQSSLTLIGAHKDDFVLMNMGKPAAIAQFVAIFISFCALTHAYVTSDFSVVNVAENSHSLKPMLYKISGVWGNHEGSMVLWVLILSFFGLTVALFGQNIPPTLRARVIGIQGLIGLSFLAFILFTSNPFSRLDPPPADGQDLNPLLQDPGLAFHPPMLYLGYVGFSVTFSFAVAALIEGKIAPAWARWVRPWALLAWTSLTAGITLGSWWAYYELGWGGWWYWDPVENASFMPWLAGTAFLHSAIVVEKRDALKSWTILLAILAFTLSLMGTFLVRSGILTSVHAFAVDPDRGLFILAILIFFVGGALILFAMRAPKMSLGGLFQPISREGGLVMNNLLLSVATATVFLGTLYPLFLDATTGQKVSVGPPFFNATFVPIMMLLLLLMAVGPMLSWRQADFRAAIVRLWFAALFSAGLSLVFWLYNLDKPVTPIIGFAIAGWLAGGTLKEFADRVAFLKISLKKSLARARGLPRSAHGMTLAHLGVAIFVCGASADSAWRTEVVINANTNDTISLAGYELMLENVEQLQGPNYKAERARIKVTKEGKEVAVLFPERRFYSVQQMLTTEAQIYSTFMADLYATIGEGNPKKGWVLRLWFNPLIPWIWSGCLLMVIGGLLSLSDRRLRIGAPKIHHQPSAREKDGYENG
ncbi:MAG: heme lyase NrfEFG subunit NrfE [Rhodospirillaceae bacterium]|nr:heme lyase NrfEFG subunit NrfE [Rhodospirillaceae bacterium]